MEDIVTCIICLGENKLSDINPLTDEHIIPEFIGGNLVVKNVCKTCNSSLGDGFEGRLANSFYFKLARQVYDIKGKQKTAPNALSGVYEHETLGKVRVNDKNRVLTFPELEVEDLNGSLNISIKIDKSDLNNAKKELSKKLQRYFKSQGKVIKKGKLSELVDRFWENASITNKIIDNPHVTGKFEWNFVDHSLLHIKVAYELLVYHFGNDYISDPVANSLRLCLKQQNLDNGVHFAFLDNCELSQFIDESNHWIYIHKSYCVVSIFGCFSSIVFTAEQSEFIENEACLYKFDVKTGKHTVKSLMDHLNSLTNT